MGFTERKEERGRERGRGERGLAKAEREREGVIIESTKRVRETNLPIERRKNIRQRRKGERERDRQTDR